MTLVFFSQLFLSFVAGGILCQLWNGRKIKRLKMQKPMSGFWGNTEIDVDRKPVMVKYKLLPPSAPGTSARIEQEAGEEEK